MRVAAARRISHNPEDEVIEFMNQWAEKAGIGLSSRKFGFDIPISGEEQAAGLRGYEYWITLQENAPESEGVEFKTIEGSTYAILRITDPMADPFERIPNGWKQLADWVNGNGYATSRDHERYWLEEVVEMQGVVYMDIYFPI